MSLVQRRLGASTVNCRPKRFGATGRLWFESVVALYFFLALALIPCSTMSFLTRSLPTRIPLASSSFHTRGQPYSPFTSAWIALICTSSASLLTRFRCRGLARRLKCWWYPLALTPSTSHCADTGQSRLCRSIQAYFTPTPSRSTPSLFLGCRAPSSRVQAPPSTG